MTRSMQTLDRLGKEVGSGEEGCLPRAKQARAVKSNAGRFRWNAHLLRPIPATCQHFCLRLIQGYVGQVSDHIEAGSKARVHASVAPGRRTFSRVTCCWCKAPTRSDLHRPVTSW